MQHTRRRVTTSFEQIQAFLRFAEKYKSDFFTTDLKWLLDATFDTLHDFIVSRYLRESSEQILRPLYFAKIGGDCDDATIFCVSLLRAAKCPKKNILICEAKSPDAQQYEHIFCGCRMGDDLTFIDNLPGTILNKLDYDMSDLRITLMSDYI